MKYSFYYRITGKTGAKEILYCIYENGKVSQISIQEEIVEDY
jgi:hypothetical protein